MKYQNILVTGGAGFIGSHLVSRLISNGCWVVVLDDFSTGRGEHLQPHLAEGNVQLIKGDIRDWNIVKKAVENVEAVFHLAALTSVPQSIEDPILVNEVNVVGTLNVLRACLKSDVKRMVYASSCAVYGASDYTLSESCFPRPISPYGASKLAAEHYCRVFYEIYGLGTVSLRYFNVYGPKQIYSQYDNVIDNFLDHLMKDEPPIIYGNGDQSRDFVNVEDVVEANLLALNNGNAAGEVFNVGTGISTTVNRLADIMIKFLGKDNMTPIHVDNKPGDIMKSCADTSMCKDVLGCLPQIPIEKGIAKFLESYTEENQTLAIH